MRILLRRVVAAKCRIAMREAAEPEDHIAMTFRMVADFRTGGIAQGFEQPDRFVLVGKGLGVFEWQVDEHALDRGHLSVEASGDRGTGDLTRMGVGGVGLRRIAEHIARQLIHQDDQCQCAWRCQSPVIEVAGTGMANGGGEAGACCVECGIFGEPFVAVPGGVGFEPEFENIGWLQIHPGSQSSCSDAVMASRQRPIQQPD